MPIRVGIDLVSVESVRGSITTHGDRYLQRVYTAQERSDCAGADGVAADRLAARFAAKEATFKVLRVGDQPISWLDVEVLRDPGGAVELSLTGRAATLASIARITAFSVSLSHEHGCAAAVVIAELQELPMCRG